MQALKQFLSLINQYDVCWHSLTTMVQIICPLVVLAVSTKGSICMEGAYLIIMQSLNLNLKVEMIDKG